MQSMQRTQELLLHHLRSLEGMVCGEGRRLPRPVYPYSDGPSEDFDPYPWYPPWSQAPQQRGHTSFMSSPPPVGRTAPLVPPVAPPVQTPEAPVPQFQGTVPNPAAPVPEATPTAPLSQAILTPATPIRRLSQTTPTPAASLPQTTPSTASTRSPLSPTDLNLPVLPSHHRPPLPLSRQNEGNAMASAAIEDWPGRRSITQVIESNHKLAKASTLAMRVAREAVFGDKIMKQCTVMGGRGLPGLPRKELYSLKNALFDLFPSFWNCPEEFESLWSGCIDAIGQACKRLRKQ